MSDAHHADKAAEILNAAIAKVHFPVDVGKHRIDLTTIGLGNLGKDVPVDLLQAQAGRQAIQTHRFRMWLRQLHIEIFHERVIVDLSGSGYFADITRDSSNHSKTPLKTHSNASEKHLNINKCCSIKP